MNFLTISLTRIKRLDAPAPMPTVSKAEAQSFFAGWWYGIAIGVISGMGAGALLAGEILK